MTIESEIERLDYIEKIVIKKVLNRVAEENLVRKDLADGYKISEVWEKHHIL